MGDRIKFHQLQVGKTYALLGSESLVHRNDVGEPIELLKQGRIFSVIGRAIHCSYKKGMKEYGEIFNGVSYAVEVFQGCKGMLVFNRQLARNLAFKFAEVVVP